MKCLDKKRIKMKQGETLALNERIMLSLVSTGVKKKHLIVIFWRRVFLNNPFLERLPVYRLHDLRLSDA